jgi:biotin carboxylase
MSVTALLVANRGEIAMRIMRIAHLGDDDGALHTSQLFVYILTPDRPVRCEERRTLRPEPT